MDSIEMVLTLLDNKARVFKLHDFWERERGKERDRDRETERRGEKLLSHLL